MFEANRKKSLRVQKRYPGDQKRTPAPIKTKTPQTASHQANHETEEERMIRKAIEASLKDQQKPPQYDRISEDE